MAIDVNVRKSLGSFSLDVAFSSKGGIDMISCIDIHYHS